MKNYRKNLVIRIRALAFLAAAAAFLGIFDAFFAEATVKANPVFGFQCGLTDGLGILALLLILRYKKALENEEKLRQLYNREKDERMSAIKSKAGMPLLLITSLAMILAGIVAGYFHVIVFYTLIAAALFQLATACIVKFLYSRII